MKDLLIGVFAVVAIIVLLNINNYVTEARERELTEEQKIELVKKEQQDRQQSIQACVDRLSDRTGDYIAIFGAVILSIGGLLMMVNGMVIMRPNEVAKSLLKIFIGMIILIIGTIVIKGSNGCIGGEGIEEAARVQMSRAS